MIKLGTYPVWNEHYHSYNFYGLFNEKEIKTVQFPSSLKEIVAGTLNNVQDAVVVSEDNPYYASENGMLYNKEMNYLLYVPSNCLGATFEIPEKAVKVTIDVVRDEKIETLVLHSKVKEINEESYSSSPEPSNLKAFEVDANNPYYASEDGVLYNKDKTELLRYPCGKEDEMFVVPKSVKSFETYAFNYIQYLKVVVIGKNVEEAVSAFTIPDEIETKPYAIVGYKGTEAENVATHYDYAFIPLDLASEW